MTRYCAGVDCPRYNIELHSKEFVFCVRCGSKLVEVDKCSCGVELGVADNFCSSCGVRNENAQPWIPNTKSAV